MSRWDEFLETLQTSVATFEGANVEAIKNTVLSGDPNAPSKAKGGACIVLNMAAADVPDFCRDGYKNIYQLETDYRLKKERRLVQVGDPPKVSETRKFVDKALDAARGIKPEVTYFAAIELSGPGIRFYGDICLVLKRNDAVRNAWLLDRNSYDLVRNPINQEIKGSAALAMAKVSEHSFQFDPYLQSVSVRKVMEQTTAPDRRLTAGEIAEKLRADEDYIEVFWQQPITAEDILEARSSASDAAAEALTTAQLRTGPAPSLAQLTSRAQRGAAQRALRKARVPFRVVTTSGRIKG